MRPLEVSVFGPGKGEAIAVHLGANEWVTVDSCVDQADGSHPVLKYFESEGVNVASDLKVVLATHAHDDHVAGIAALYRAAAEATLLTSYAMTSEEFFAVARTDLAVDRQLRMSVYREYRQAFDDAKTRKRANSSLRPLGIVGEQRVIWPRPGIENRSGAHVVALSPSDEAFHRSIAKFAEVAAAEGQRKKLPSIDPNELAIAVWIEVAGTSVLLGADLTRGPRGCGWHAVLATHQPDGKATLIKIPHHGSRHSHHDGVWSELLDERPVSVIAPFRHGRVSLPTNSDVVRIKNASASVHVTATTKSPTPSALSKTTAAKLQHVAKAVRPLDGRCGHVRAQWNKVANSWEVGLTPPAKTL